MWHCPKCGQEVEDDYEVCWQCGTNAEGVEDPAFQTADEAGPIHDPALDFGRDEPVDLGDLPEPLEDLVPCFEASSTIEARFVADQLVGEGIPAVAERVSNPYSLGHLGPAWLPGPRVMVRRRDLARAAAWVDRYGERQQARKPGPGPELEGQS